METFEILAFEYQDLYDGEDTNLSNVVEKFVAFYKLYFVYCDTPKEYISFTTGKSFISYTDKTGGDKPIMLMLIGKLNETLIDEIKSEIEKFYN